MQRQPDGLDDAIEAIDAAITQWGIGWLFLKPELKRVWIEEYAREHAHQFNPEDRRYIPDESTF